MSIRAIVTAIGIVLAASLLTQSDTIARGGGGSHGGRMGAWGRNGNLRGFDMHRFPEAHHGNEHRGHDEHREYRNARDAHSPGGRWSGEHGGHGRTAHSDNGVWSQGAGFGDTRTGSGPGFGDTNVGRRPRFDGAWHTVASPQ